MKKRILVVDDVEAVCEALQAVLRAPGVEVDTASTLDSALALLDRTDYDGVVSDLRLSGSHGEEGLAVIRSFREKCPKAPAVLISGYARGKHVEAAAALGCRFLEKPVHPQVLLDILSPVYESAAESVPTLAKKSAPYGWYLLTRPMQFALDGLVLSGALLLAYLLRYEFDLSRKTLGELAIQLPLVLLVQFAALYLAGVYDFIWRYVGLTEVKAFVWASVGAAIPLFGMRLFLPDSTQEWRLPLSVIVMDAIMMFGGVLGLRVLRRILFERYERSKSQAGALSPDNGGAAEGGVAKKKVLLIGAGRAGVIAAREIAGRAGSNLDVKGFLDDDPEKKGAVVNGIRVLGEMRDLPVFARQYGIDHVIITIAHAPRTAITAIVEACEAAAVRVRIIPSLYEILDGSVAISRIRDVEIEDLLGRDAVKLDKEAMGVFLSGKVVMVTGAGGSIGSELARQVAAMAPSRLLLVERAEFVLFDVHRELVAKHPELDLIPLVADVGDESRMGHIYEKFRPAVVVHAAAHKHVPMMEKNPCEAVKNNILGTEIAARLAGEHGVEAFILISTDKAVKPRSIMGASKRMAELVCQVLNSRFDTRFVAVRFGNVLGSTGSVVPIFREQIAKGGPVTVTHPEMVRYFMTIPEAAQLVLQAGAMGKGGEIFVLDMGEPVKIVDLAKQMIILSGFKPGEEIEIVFTGVRPGEKMSEELMGSDEAVGATRHPKIFIGTINGVDGEKVIAAVDELATVARCKEPEKVRAVFARALPEARL